MREALTIRPEREEDHPLIDRIQESAFGRPDEARLVRSLRSAASPHRSLVAVEDDRLVGHIFFSPVRIEGPGSGPACTGLAQVAVVPEAQGRGIGDALVRAGLEECRRAGWKAVFLLGNPAYYHRFGFELSAPRGLRYESEDFDSAFQFLELESRALDGCRGFVRFHDAFSEV